MTFMTPAEEQVLKTDRVGRVQTPEARREQLLDEFERSGLSGMKFAALVGIKYQTFAAWRKRRRAQKPGTNLPAKRGDSMRWLEAVVEQAQGPGGGSPNGVVVELPGGGRLQISTVNQAVVAAALLRALEKSAC